MNEKVARRLSLELMEVAEAAYLTTIDGEGFPQTRAMFNLRRKEQFPALSELFGKHRDDFLIYFTTNTSSLKMEQIRENPKVCVYYCRPGEWRGLLLKGEIEIVMDKGIKEALWQKGWQMYYPGGAYDTDHTVLRLCPIHAKYYQQLDRAQFTIARKP